MDGGDSRILAGNRPLTLFRPESSDVPRVRPSAQDRSTPSQRKSVIDQIDRSRWRKEILANDECREKQTMRPIIDGGDNERSPTLRPIRPNPVHRLGTRTEDPMERFEVVAVPQPGFAFLVRKSSWTRLSVLVMLHHPCHSMNFLNVSDRRVLKETRNCIMIISERNRKSSDGLILVSCQDNSDFTWE
jgi:hypothetical protein